MTAQRYRFRPQVEVLESREVPSTTPQLLPTPPAPPAQVQQVVAAPQLAIDYGAFSFVAQGATTHAVLPSPANQTVLLGGLPPILGQQLNVFVPGHSGLENPNLGTGKPAGELFSPDFPAWGLPDIGSGACLNSW